MPLVKRKSKLVDYRIQLRAIAVGALVVLIVLFVQNVTMTYTLNRLANDLPNDSGTVLAKLPSILLTSFGVSLSVLLPVLMLIGLHATHRVAGPLISIQRHMRAIIDGDETGPLRVRKKDELQDFCALVNEFHAHFTTERGRTSQNTEVSELDTTGAALPSAAEISNPTHTVE